MTETLRPRRGACKWEVVGMSGIVLPALACEIADVMSPDPQDDRPERRTDFEDGSRLIESNGGYVIVEGIPGGWGAEIMRDDPPAQPDGVAANGGESLGD